MRDTLLGDDDERSGFIDFKHAFLCERPHRSVELLERTWGKKRGHSTFSHEARHTTTGDDVMNPGATAVLKVTKPTAAKTYRVWLVK